MAHTCNSSIRETREGAMLEPDSLSYRVGAKRNRKCWRDGSTVKSALSEIPSLFSIIHTGVPQLPVTPALGNPMPSSGSHKALNSQRFGGLHLLNSGIKGVNSHVPWIQVLMIVRQALYPLSVSLLSTVLSSRPQRNSASCSQLQLDSTFLGLWFSIAWSLKRKN